MCKFKKKNKLDNHSFKLGFKLGKRLFIKKSAVAIFRKNNLNFARVGIVLPKKHIKKASARNSQKRYVREWFRTKKKYFIGVDLILLLKDRFDTEVIKDENKIISFAKKLEENN